MTKNTYELRGLRSIESDGVQSDTMTKIEEWVGLPEGITEKKAEALLAFLEENNFDCGSSDDIDKLRKFCLENDI